MLRAALFGAAVTLALIIIPVVHFVTALPSPFIGGYIAGAKAEVGPDRGLALGALMALVLVAPLAGVLLAVSVIFLHLSLIAYSAVLAEVFCFVAALGGLGAALGGAHARRQAT